MIHYAGETEALALLRRAVHHAQHALASSPSTATEVNAVLTTLAAELAPGFPHLYAVADAQPFGPVATVLSQLRIAFAHAAAGRPAPAATSLATASASALELPG